MISGIERGGRGGGASAPGPGPVVGTGQAGFCLLIGS